MKVHNSDISIIRGDSETLTVKCRGVNDECVPFETGDKIYLTVKKKTSDIENVIQKVVTEFTEGRAVIEISHLDTKDLECIAYKYDIRLVQEGVVTTLVPVSTFLINREVSVI